MGAQQVQFYDVHHWLILKDNEPLGYKEEIRRFIVGWVQKASRAVYNAASSLNKTHSDDAF